jgi:hypothetical protein
MGNLEKAGVLVVVALLAMILVITVMNPPAEVPTVKEGPTPSSQHRHAASDDDGRPRRPADASSARRDSGPVGGEPTTLRPVRTVRLPSNPLRRSRKPVRVTPASKCFARCWTPRNPPSTAPCPSRRCLISVKVKVAKGDTFAKIAEKALGKRCA